jgi:hypothetical protein
MRRFIAVGALAALASASAAGASAATSPAPSRPSLGRIGIRERTIPYSQRNNPRDRLYIVQHVSPGTRIHRLIQVANMSPKKVRLQVYPAAASISHGQFLFARGRTPNQLTTWTRVSSYSVTLAPHQLKTLRVTIAVPRNASRGEQFGVIWAQDVGSRAGPPGRHIMLVNRVGIRMYLSVGPGGPRPSNFTVSAPYAHRGQGNSAVVSATVNNTGGSALDIGGTLTLTGGPGGLKAGPFPSATVATVAPGQSAAITFRMGRGIPNGPWRASLHLQSGLIVRNEQASIDFAKVPARPPWLPILSALAAVLVVVALGAVVLTRRRRLVRQHA